MYVALICIILFVCIILVLVVLSQNSKGGGLSSQFGAGSSQLMGVKRTGDLLEKLTWGLAITLVILTLSSHMIVDKNAGPVQSRSVNMDKASQERAAPAAAPAIPSMGNQAPAANTAPASKPAVSTPGVSTDSSK